MDRKSFIQNVTLIGLTSVVPFSEFIGDVEGRIIELDNHGRQSEAATLLSRLDLNKPGLEKVKASKNTSLEAVRELLDYYRSRESVEFFIGPKPNHKIPKMASKKDIKWADNALKHILVGQPEYPPYFCGKDINWNTRPYGDMEWVWQLNRMYFWNAMARAYWATNEQKYAREWTNQFIDWIEDNPRDGHHQYAWRSIEAGIRGSRWTKLFQRFIPSASFTPTVLVRFLNSIYDHATYLMTQYSKGSNWALIEAQGLGYMGLYFPEFKDATGWRNEAIRRFNQEIYRQVNPDGFQHELSMNYHVGAIGWFLHIFELAKMNGLQEAFPASYPGRVELMCADVMKLILPDGTTAQFGDAWKGKPDKYQSKFKKWGKLFGREDFLYLAMDGQEGKKPASTAYALKYSGYYSMRSSWNKDAICLVLKCGLNGGFHCQPDNGSFVLYTGGRHLMPDSGSYSYGSEGSNARDWFRQTKVHQTLTLNGKNSAYAPNLLLWEPGEEIDKLVVENQSYPELLHRRAVLFIEKKFFVLVDEAIGEAIGNVDLHFQLAPDEKAIFDKKDMSVRSGFRNGWNVFVQTVQQPGLLLQKEKGQVSFVYTQKQPRPAFRYRIHKEDSKGLRFVTVVIPYRNSTPKVNVRVIGEPTIGASHMELDVEAERWGIQRRIGYKL